MNLVSKKNTEVFDLKKSTDNAEKKFSNLDVSKKNFEKEKMALQEKVWENEADKHKELDSHITITDSKLWQLETKIEVEKWSDVLKKELQDSNEKSEIFADVEKLWESFEKGNVEMLALKVLEDPSKKIEQSDKVVVESFSIYVGWNVIGSLYKNLMMKSKSRSGSIDQLWFQKYLDFYPVDNLENLQKSLISSDTKLSDSEKKVLEFLSGDSVFAKEYREKTFPNVAQTMRQSMPEFVSDYNKLVAEGQWVTDTIKKSAGYLWEWAKGVFDKEEWKNNPGKVALWTASVIGGAYLGYKTLQWIFDWFGGDSEGEKKETDDSKKKNKKSLFWKMTSALKRGVPIAGGALLVNWLLTGKWMSDVWGDLKNFFGIWEAQDKTKSGWSSTTPWGAEKPFESNEELKKKNPEIQKKFADFAGSINDFYAGVYGEKEWTAEDDVFGESEYEKDALWTIPYMLNSRYATVGDILSESAFFYEIAGSSSGVFFDALKKMWFEGLKKFLMPLAEWVDALSWWFVKSADSLDKLIEGLKGRKDAEQIIRMVFRKSLKVMAYLQTRKKTLTYFFAKEYLEKNDSGFSGLSDEAKKQKIMSSLEDEKFYSDHLKKRIEDEFLSGKLLSWDASNLQWALVNLEKYGLMNGELDELTKSVVKNIEEQKKNILQDDGEGNAIEKISQKLAEWKLGEAEKKLSWNVISDFQNHIKDTGARSFYSSALSGLWQFLNTEDNSTEQIIKAMNYEWVVKKYLDGSQEILTKINQDKATPEDFKNLQELVDDYFMLQKEIEVWANQLLEIKQGNWNYLIRWGFGIMRSGQDLFHWVQMVVDGKRVKGGMVTAAGAVTLDVLTFGKVLWWYPTKAALWTGNVILKPALMLTGKTAFNLSSRLLPARFVAGIYKDGTRLSYAVAKWELSLDRALAIAQRNGLSFASWPNGKVATKLELLEALFPSSAANPVDYKKLEYIFEKCGNNKKLIGKILAESWYVNYNWMSPKDRLKMDKSKMLFRVKGENLNEIYNLVENLNQWWDEEKKFLEWLLEWISHNNLKKISDWLDPKYIKYFNDKWLIKPKELGKLFAQYADNLDDLDDVQLFIDEAYKAGKITSKNWSAFVRNSLKDWGPVKKIWKKEWISGLDSLELWLSKTEKSLKAVWDGFDKAKSYFSRLLNNPKVPATMKKSIQSSYEWISQISQDVLTPDTINASKNFNLFGDLSQLKNINVAEMKKISTLLQTDKKIAKLLSKTKDISEIKKILLDNWIDVTKVDAFVIEKIAKSGSTKKVIDWVSYAAESENLTQLQTVLKHPSAKMLGRVLAKAGVALDFIFVWLEFKDNAEKTAELAVYNKERADVMKSQTVFDLVAGGSSASLGLAALSIPGVGWAAGWLALAGLGMKELWDVYYDQLHEHYKNFEDFSHQAVAQTKQNIISLNAYEHSIDPSWWAWLKGGIDKISGSAESEKNHTYTTVADAVRALIFIEETQKNPLSAVDLNKLVEDKARGKIDTKLIVEAKQDRAQRVEKRMKFFEHYRGKNLIDPVAIQKNNWLVELDKLLEKSADYAFWIDNGYDFSQNKMSYGESLKKSLIEKDKESFEKIEKIRHDYPRDFALMVRQISSYYQLLEQNKDGHEKYHIIKKNFDFFADYMKWCWAQKDFQKSLSFKTDQNDAENIDYVKIEWFFEKWTMQGTGLDRKDIKKSPEKNAEKKLLDEYGISRNIGHTILLRIAREVYSYAGSADLESLKNFFSEAHYAYHWIYFKDGKWWANDDHWFDEWGYSDWEISDVSVVKKFLDDIVWQSEKGDLISSGNAEIQLNLEIGKQIKNIFQEELDYRENSNKYAKKIEDYIRKNSQWKFIELPVDLICIAARIWFPESQQKMYSRDWHKIQTT